MIAMFAAYPLYTKHGYIGIDTAKYQFLKYVLITGIIALTVSTALQIIFKLMPMQSLCALSGTDIAVLVYAASVIISTVFSYDRDTALYGQTGWFMGCLLILAFVYIYFAISRMWVGDNISLNAMIIASFITCALCVINRFNIWPIDMPGHGDGGFVSTLGNIGWFCGYLSIVTPVGIGMFLLKRGQSRIEHTLLGLYTFTVFAACMCQGGDSVLLFWAVLFAVGLVVLSVYNDGIMYWLEMLMLWALSGQLIHLLRTIWPKQFTYNSANFCNFFNNKNTTLWIFIILLAVYILLHKYRHNIGGKINFYMKLLPAIAAVCIVLFLIIAVTYTKYTGTVPEGEIDQYDSRLLGVLLHRLFYLDGQWGSGRGATIASGIKIFQSFSPIRKIIGVGPDCFAIYAYNTDITSNYLNQYFSGLVLTNAHNEMVTNMVNIGIVGGIAYYGMLSTFIVECYRHWKQDTRLLYIIIAVSCYIGYNMLNFAQILNYPYLFILMGIGSAWMKHADIRLKRMGDTEGT